MSETVFKIFYQRFYSSLYHFAIHLIGNPNDAAEIVNDVFLNVWHKRNNLKLDESLKPYLFRSVKNSCINYHKKIKPIHTDLDQTKQTSMFTADGPLLDKEQQNRLVNLLDSLPPKCKQVFIMSRIDELSYKEIAELLDLSIKTVEAQMSKALKIFRKNLRVE